MVTEKKIERTKAYTFILPMIGESINDYKGVVNCYIASKGDEGEDYGNQIFVLFKFNPSKDFTLFERKLEQHPLFLHSYDPSPKYVMFVFKVPDEYKLEYSLFISEKPNIYKRFSDSYKKHILKFLEPSVETDSIKEILYSHESRYKELEKKLGVKIPRDIDNYQIPDLEQETFNKLTLYG